MQLWLEERLVNAEYEYHEYNDNEIPTISVDDIYSSLMLRFELIQGKRNHGESE